MSVNTVASLANLLPSEVVTAEYLRLLADRDFGFLSHPALIFAGDLMGKGADTFDMPQLGLDGYRLLEQVAEGSQVQHRAIDDDVATVTVAPWRKAYEFSDLARAVDLGLLTPTVLARDALMATANTLVYMLAQLVGGFSNSSGTPGNALTGLDLLTAKAQLAGRSVEPPYVALLSASQIEDFHGWLAATSGGGVQWMPATQEQLMARGIGYQGNWGGIDIYLSNRIPTSGANSLGGMFGRGAIIWSYSSFAPEPDANIVDFGAAAGGRAPVRFERERAGTAGTTTYITHAQLGVAEAIDAAGETISTLAT